MTGSALRREDTIDDSQMMRQQMAAMGGASAPGADVQKLFDQERQGLELVSTFSASWWWNLTGMKQMW